VVAVAELELDDVADRRGDRVGNENVLLTTNDDGDDLAGTTDRLGRDCIVG
jgi:hypothetical protein